MTDGAHLGVGAERALGTILSGQPQPEADEQETPEAVRARVLAAADRGGEPTGYGDCADMAAGMILRCAEREPGVMDLGERELFDRVNALTEGRLSDLHLTGFMWGWAVNAARYTADLPPEPNPAILVVEP